ncbi:MAG: DNA cytosine methyltransferase [Veillonellales bacterium]
MLKKIGFIDKDCQGQRVYDTQGISQQLTAQGGGWGAKTGLYMLNKNIRRLTPKECERLQGFPDNWTEGISESQRYKCLGNAVSVPVVKEIIKRLFKI